MKWYVSTKYDHKKYILQVLASTGSKIFSMYGLDIKNQYQKLSSLFVFWSFTRWKI